MKQLLFAVGLLLVLAFPARGTITEIQHPQTSRSTCSKTVNTCTLTVAPTGSGHFAVVMITLMSSSNTWVTSITDNKGGSWTVPGNSGSGGCYLFTGAYGTTGCAYNLALPAGVTSITGTWSMAIPEGAEMDFREYAYTGPSVSLDNIGSYGHPAVTATSIVGIAPVLSGTNDVIVQSIATGSDYATGVTVYGNENVGDTYFASADLLNTTSTEPPTFTLCCTVAAYAVIYVAIKESSSPNVYVAQTPLGQNTGADCADALSYSAVSYNMPGTTYHLCGTFSLPAGSSGPITISASGTPGNPITIKFEAGASATAPYWGPNGFIYAAGESYITVDGGANGSISATANGTTLANQSTPSSGIYFTNVSSSEIKNLTVSNIYVHRSSPNDEVGTQDTWGIQWVNGSNVTIDNNTIHDAYGCIYYTFAPSATSSTVKIFDNTAFNCNSDITTAAGGAGAILGTDLIYGNVLHDWSNWDETANQNSHAGISVFTAGAGAQVTGLQIYNNLVYGNMTVMTAYLSLLENPGTILNAYVFNNVFYNVGTGYPADGYLDDWSSQAFVFNNTIVGRAGSSNGGSAYNQNGIGSTLYNNIFTTCYVGFSVNTGASIAASDYNDIYGCNDVGLSQGSFETTLANWQAATGLDGHSTSGNSLLSPSSAPPYQLSSTSSAAFRTASNLSSYCATVPALCTDFAGNTRPSTGAWDMGAFFLGGGASQAAVPVCTPGAGTYNNAPSVGCSNPSSAPVLCYTTNGTVPATNGLTGCTSGAVVSGSIGIFFTGTNLQVVAGGTGFTDSSPASNTYALTAAAPTFSPVAGSYPSSQNVTISTATTNASLLYCFDTTNTCTPGTPYSGPVAVSSSGFLRAQGTLAGFTNSSIASAPYTIGTTTGMPSITLIQHPQTTATTCSGSVNTCTLTIAPTGSNHFGVVMISLLSSKNTWVTSITDNQGGTWIVPGSSGSGGCYQFSGSYGGTGCAYNLTLPAGVTSITGTWSSAVTQGARMDFREYAYTGSGIALDSVGIYSHPANGATTVTGISPLLTGANDVIVQSFTSGSDRATGVTTYGDANIGVTYFGSADLLNTNSTTAPTFPLCCTTAAYGVAYIAITEL